MSEKFEGEIKLNEILDKDPGSIVEVEREILKARISYLTKEQIERFGLNKKAKGKGEVKK